MRDAVAETATVRSLVLEPPYAAPRADVCGPAGFMHDVAGFLTGLGVEADRIHSEAFAAAPR